MEPFIGQIQAFGFNFPPRGWATCDGQLLPIAQNTALFALIGTIYGGNGTTTFGLPDLRGRAPLHFGTGPGLSPKTIGSKSGTETNTLIVNNLPAHSHPVALGVKEEGNTDDPNGAFIAGDGTNAFGSTSDGNLASSTSGNTGANQAVNNMQPFLTINFCIALTGIFPSRN